MTYFLSNSVVNSLSPGWSRRCSTAGQFRADCDGQFLDLGLFTIDFLDSKDPPSSTEIDHRN